MYAGEGGGAVRVERDKVLPLGMLDVLSAADLEGPKVVCATATDSVGVAKKRWGSRSQCKPLLGCPLQDKLGKIQGGPSARTARRLGNWVDLDLGCSTVCPIWLGQMGIWQNWLCGWARLWNIPNLSQPDPSPRADGSPCTGGCWRCEHNAQFRLYL